MSHELSERAVALLEEYYPQPLHNSHQIHGLVQAVGHELGLIDEALAMFERNLAVASALEFLPLYESQVGIPVGGSPGQSLSARRDAVAAYMRKASLRGTGAEWVELGRIILGNTWTYELIGTNNSVLRVFIPYAVDSTQHGLIKRLFEAISPASVRVLIVSEGGPFVLDSSLLDDGTLG